ncbi:trypsin 5G1-like [Venturia canescens]|uniref:trypsin 5G1-like n=1 Tax=Venturia canescens TaxID=32260 RepID=UPI001C9CE975|nr:trypsin 5G1-like [Venturia canescens]
MSHLQAHLGTRNIIGRRNAVNVLDSSKKNAVYSAVKSSYNRGLLSSPRLGECDAHYVKKYGSPLKLEDSGTVRPGRMFGSSEFLSVERLPNEVFDHGYDGFIHSSEFLIHDYDVGFLSDDFEKYFHWRGSAVNTNVNNRPSRVPRQKLKNHQAKRKSRKFSKKKSKVETNLGDEIEAPFYTENDTFSSLFRNPMDMPSGNNSTEKANMLRWLPGACGNVRRIVGGWNIKSIEQLPYMAFIDSGCGGSIIGTRWVITSAQCLIGYQPKFVYVGSIDLLGGCEHGVERTYRHPKFSNKGFSADIGLIMVKPNFVYSPAIKPIKFTSKRARVGLCGIVSGWGAQRHGGELSRKLKMTIIPVVLRYRCLLSLTQRELFCAGYIDGKADSCQGDSGGPFVAGGLLYGITSFGFKCGRRRSPGVYVQISSYRNWIHSVSGV